MGEMVGGLLDEAYLIMRVGGDFFGEVIGGDDGINLLFKAVDALGQAA